MERISFTLYDLVGYLLPGGVVLFACSILESTFLGSDVLSLPHIKDNLIIAAIGAYFLGHLGHRLGSVLEYLRHTVAKRIRARISKSVSAKARVPFGRRTYRLSGPLFQLVRKTVQQVYDIDLAEGEKLNTLETYVLTDSYITASGGAVERDIWIAVEGFYKTSVIAFGVLSLVLLGSLFVGGANIWIYPQVLHTLGRQLTAVLAGVILLITLLFQTGVAYHGQLKRNNTYTLFLALQIERRGKETESD